MTPTCEIRIADAGAFDHQAWLAFLAPRLVAGVESLQDGTYRRAGRAGAGRFVVSVSRDRLGATVAEVRGEAGDTRALADRLRALVGVDHAVDAADACLRRDPLLRPAIVARPGLTVPGTLDPFELALRAVLGQQVSVAGAATLAGRLVRRFGEDVGFAGFHLFPAPSALLDADVGMIGLPRSRAETIRALARAAQADHDLLRPGARSLAAAVAALDAVRGIGPWTAHYIAMRALRHADAFPEADLGLLKAVGEAATPSGKRALLARAEAWRPHRAAATLRLWSLLG